MFFFFFATCIMTHSILMMTLTNNKKKNYTCDTENVFCVFPHLSEYDIYIYIYLGSVCLHVPLPQRSIRDTDFPFIGDTKVA